MSNDQTDRLDTPLQASADGTSPRDPARDGTSAAYSAADPALSQGHPAGGYPPPPYAGQGPYAPQVPYGGPGQAPFQGQYAAPHQQHDGGPGFGDRASQAISDFGRHVKTPETKEFFKTSEFGVWLFTVVAIAIAGAVIDFSSGGDVLRADLVWKLIAGVSAVYILSRGIAKAGTRRGYGERPLDRG